MSSDTDLTALFSSLSSGHRMLGQKPWSQDGQLYIRSSQAVPQGIQVFAKAEGSPGVPDIKGKLLAVARVTQTREDLIGKFDTIVLNPMDYEAVKKSTQESYKRDLARRDRKGPKLDLSNFDSTKAFRN